jgi:hypothetical protein
VKGCNQAANWILRSTWAISSRSHRMSRHSAGPYRHIRSQRRQGLPYSQLLTLGALVVYQLVMRDQHEQHLPLGKGSKSLLRAA